MFGTACLEEETVPMRVFHGLLTPVGKVWRRFTAGVTWYPNISSRLCLPACTAGFF
jgi:hypothetical protein